jgi:hypothetical protein
MLCSKVLSYAKQQSQVETNRGWQQHAKQMLAAHLHLPLHQNALQAACY